jgi:hypothetical protein
MTLYYATSSWSSQPQVPQKTVDLWNHVKRKTGELCNYQMDFTKPNI